MSDKINFDKFLSYDGLGTWDEVVECGWGDPTTEQSKIIVELGFYGLPIEKKHIELLNKSERIVQKEFTFKGLGDDGFPWFKEFDIKKDFIDYAKKYPGMKNGSTSWVDDDGRNFIITGSTYDEIFK